MAAIQVKCPLCDIGILEDKVIDYKTTLKDGEHYRHIVVEKLPVEICPHCKEVILPKESMERVYSERHTIRHLLTPAQLKKIRIDLKLTQIEMAVLLGVGKKSYLRWEKGYGLQTRSMDRYIRLLTADPRNIQFLKRLSESGM